MLNAHAQSQRAEVGKTLNQLHSSTLVVLLESYHKTIGYYDMMIQKGGTSQAAIEKKRINAIAERDAKNKALVNAFSQQYLFSKVLFLYDYQYNFKTQEITGAFLNTQLQADHTITLTTPDFFIGGLMDRMNRDQFKYQFYTLRPDGTELPDKVRGEVQTTFLIFKRSPNTIVYKLNKRLTRAFGKYSK
jgi:hypothetical protein